MRRLALFSFLLLATLALPVLAKEKEPTVGPLDGKEVESLPPLDTPASTDTVVEKMPETALADSMEKAGDYTTALAEWQRIAYNFTGNDRAHALLRAASAQLALKQPEAAAHTLKIFLTEFTIHAGAPEARYRLATTLTGPARTAYLKQLAALNPRTPYDDAALYKSVYEEGLATGKVTQTYGLPQAQSLQTKLTMLGKLNTERKAAAVTLSAIPGVGLVYLKYQAEGGMLLTIWALFGLAFASACRHRQYAYAFLFVFPFVALWLTAPGVAATHAGELATKERLAAMPTWSDLQPVDPAK